MTTVREETIFEAVRLYPPDVDTNTSPPWVPRDAERATLGRDLSRAVGGTLSADSREVFRARFPKFVPYLEDLERRSRTGGLATGTVLLIERNSRGELFVQEFAPA